MFKKILKIKALIFIITISGLLYAMDWPLPDAELVQNFGANDQGTPVLGTMLEGEGIIVATGPGELIFASSGKEAASRLPSPLGSWTAIAHSDGLVSIYSRYMDEGRKRTEGSMQSAYMELGNPIARSGVSGWSRNNGVYYILYDRRERRWVNALMVITLPPDTAEPYILSVQMQSAGGKAGKLAYTRFAGDWPLRLTNNMPSFAFIVSKDREPISSPFTEQSIRCGGRRWPLRFCKASAAFTTIEYLPWLIFLIWPPSSSLPAEFFNCTDKICGSTVSGGIVITIRAFTQRRSLRSYKM